MEVAGAFLLPQIARNPGPRKLSENRNWKVKTEPMKPPDRAARCELLICRLRRERGDDFFEARIAAQWIPNRI